MRGIIVVFHGSRARGSKEIVNRIMRRIRPRCKGDRLFSAYLRYGTPSLEHVLDRCARSAVDEVVTVPFFLQTGSHVVTDIPRMLENAGKRFPGVRFRLTKAVGAHPLMADIVADLINRKGSMSRKRVG